MKEMGEYRLLFKSYLHELLNDQLYFCTLIITSLFIVYRFDSTTGTFTVPPGGDGLYYFSVYLTVIQYDYGRFNIQVNGETVCTAFGDANSRTFTDIVHTCCSGVAIVAEGKKIKYLSSICLFLFLPSIVICRL